jgi:SMI1 / KNR4 family (SUKH-1)
MSSEKMKGLVEKLAEALRELDVLLFDEEYPHVLGAPCSSDQIASLERKLGSPLPPSYLAFMRLHNGWSDFDGEAQLLGSEDQTKEWVAKKIKSIGSLFYEDKSAVNPFSHGSIPVLLGKDENNYVVLDPTTARSDGEMDFVQYEFTEEERRFPDFGSFLEHELELHLEMIEEEKEGADDEDDDED